MIHVSVKIRVGGTDKVLVDCTKDFSKESDSIKFCKRVADISKKLKKRCLDKGLEETCYSTSVDVHVSKIQTKRTEAMVGDTVRFKGKSYVVISIPKNNFYRNHPTNKKLNAFGKEVPEIINVGKFYSGRIKNETESLNVSFDKCKIIKRIYPKEWQEDNTKE
jgi:signal peptidase I